MSKMHYLGDGAYVEYDGWQYCLKTERGIGNWHEVYLDPHALDALFRFIEKTHGVKIAMKHEEPAND